MAIKKSTSAPMRKPAAVVPVPLAVAPKSVMKVAPVTTEPSKASAKSATVKAPLVKTPVVKAAPIRPVAVKAAPAKVETVKAEPVKVKPVTVPSVVAMQVTDAPIEDVVAVSPVVETIKTTLAELPKRISGAVAEITKTHTEVNTHMDKAIKSAEEIVSFNQGNLEAMMKSSQIWAAGLQDLGKHFAATAQAQMDETMATVKALTSVKSLKEAVDMQTSIAKTAMEKMMAETGKLTDASVKLAEQTMAPITARMTLAVEKFGRTA